MRKTVIAVLALCAVVVGRADAQYMPFGPQQNVSLATITGGGWTECYTDFMGAPIGNNAEAILTPCQGTNIMAAGRATGSDNILLLAWGGRADVIFDTGAGTNATHPVNGSEWYYSPSWAWGFLQLGGITNQNQCDFQTPGDQRFCLHTLDWVGGYRIGDIGDDGAPQSENYDFTNYEKIFFVNDAVVGPVVPEPSTVALLGTGLVGLMGYVRRRRKFTDA
jgi:hypothetical protein